jgi:hypothetical protein
MPPLALDKGIYLMLSFVPVTASVQWRPNYRANEANQPKMH